MPFNPTDVAVLLILILSALLAFARGFVREVLSVAAWIGSAAIAWFAFPFVQPLVASKITSATVASAVSAGAVFLVALIVLSIIASRIAGLVRGSSLSAVDRSLGFLFGLARGAVLICLAYLLLIQIYPDPTEHPTWLRDARTMPSIQAGAEQLRRLVPDPSRTPAQQRAEALARAEASRRAEQDALRRLSTPVPHPASADAQAVKPGYKAQERSGLDQLIETSNQAR
ncbi:CvpA family protein [Arenibaculum pallidiluteum]|uniref:CvpA family protein n=1 Tax=Arenibaculum pallidiluteum TaxID=2812559 RepID=UPI001A95E4D1|nr:CvpA family protein [Arenibaculum pallidiluteum]